MMSGEQKKELLGKWDIVTWEQRYDDGRITYPLGRSLAGFIRYDPDGTMVCIIADKDRPRMSGGQWNSPDGDKVCAYTGFFTYSGPYTVAGDIVTHHVEISLFPNWEGGDQKRRFRLEGDRREITARLEEGSAQARTALLAWRRSATPPDR